MSPPRSPRHITVLGAGLSGLTAAYRLAQAARTGAAKGLAGSRISLVDASRTGGWVSTAQHRVSWRDELGSHDGEIGLEAGPRSIRPRGAGAAKMLKLIQDVDLSSAILPISKSHPAAKNRYLLNPETRSLDLVPMSPLAPFRRSTPKWLRAFMLSAAAEPIRRNPRGWPSDGDVTADGDESVLSFLVRRLGPAAAPVVTAFVHGIYAADAGGLSVRAAFPALYEAERRGNGSFVLGMLRGPLSKKDKEAEEALWELCGELGRKRKEWSMYALRGGMQTLTSRLEEHIRELGVDVRVGERVETLRPTNDELQITFKDGQTLSTDHVVSALPPARLSGIIGAAGPSAALPHLTANTSTTVGVVNVVYPLPPSQVHPDGFGYLIPHTPEHINPEGALGVVFDSTALPGTDTDPSSVSRSLEGKVTKLTVMMGGPYWNAYRSSSTAFKPPCQPTSAGALVEPALRHLHATLPHLANVDPLLVCPHLNVACIPTYAPGHGARLRELHEAISTGPWATRLSVVGAGYGGVSVNDCVYGAEDVVQSLASGGDVTGLERWANWE